MSRTGRLVGRIMRRFPRVSGDEPAHASSIMTKLRFSPREWGVAYDNEDRDEPQEVFLA